MSSETRPPHDPNDRRAWRTDQEWDRLRTRLAEPDLARPGRRPVRAPWLIAAGVVALATGLAWRYAKPSAPIARVATTAAGERIVIHLADSSTITLGPASTVRYALGRAHRDVTLDGLAEFKVAHDDKRPFVVHAGNAVATDVGTEFVVRAYAGDSTVDVAVTSGAVSLAGATLSDHLELHAGDVGQVSANGVASLDKTHSAAAHAAWVDGRLVFNDETLATVAVELSRWFGVDLRVAGDSIQKRRVSAVYNDPSLTGVLDALSTTLGLRVERTDRTITLRPRGK